MNSPARRIDPISALLTHGNRNDISGRKIGGKIRSKSTAHHSKTLKPPIRSERKKPIHGTRNITTIGLLSIIFFFLLKRKTRDDIIPLFLLACV